MKKIITLLFIINQMFVFAQETVNEDNFTDTISFENAPKRINDLLPLSDQTNKSNWKRNKLLWDEFDGKRLNINKWYPNNPKWIGRKPTFFHASNTSLKGGELVMKLNQHGSDALPEGYTHTAGFIKSKNQVKYGYFEAKLKPINATWMTGFWMTNVSPDWWTEIDICENGPGIPANRYDLNSNIHVFKSPKKYGGITKHFSRSKKYRIPFQLQADYHVWGLEWTKEFIRFYLDGVLFREAENTHWHQPLEINFNCESNKWFGALPDDAGIKEEYHVEYFRAWKMKKK